MNNTLVWATEDGQRYLTTTEFCPLEHGQYATHQKGEPSDANLDDLVKYCELEAEGANMHSLNGVHKLLASLLVKRLGKCTTEDIMRMLAEEGGLSGLAERRHEE